MDWRDRRMLEWVEKKASLLFEMIKLQDKIIRLLNDGADKATRNALNYDERMDELQKLADEHELARPATLWR